MIRIISPFACAGVVIRNGKVIMAAPIFGWMTGKPADWVMEYCKKRGWMFQEL